MYVCVLLLLPRGFLAPVVVGVVQIIDVVFCFAGLWLSSARCFFVTDTDAESGFDGIGSMNQQPRSRCLSSSGRGFSLGYSGEGERESVFWHTQTHTPSMGWGNGGDGLRNYYKIIAMRRFGFDRTAMCDGDGDDLMPDINGWVNMIKHEFYCFDLVWTGMDKLGALIFVSFLLILKYYLFWQMVYRPDNFINSGFTNKNETVPNTV